MQCFQDVGLVAVAGSSSPSRSLGLTSWDFFPWGYVEQHVFQTLPASVNGSKDRFDTVLNNIPRATLAAVKREVLCRVRHFLACGGRLIPHSTLEHLYSHAKYGDQNYENKEDCDWIISAKDNQRIQLRFLTFELEHEQDCSYDYVDIFNGYDDSSPHLGRFCGNKVPPEILSSSDSLLVRFRSDDTINNKGFSAAYIAIDGDEVYPKLEKH
ncbi:tolloid-like protein 2 [Centruroides sculpturatus]|uniref:tolloid-like protein 2 n=1 Tax=Centruroides sculpturatus TaxID=218467 RepID=UPI000C6CA658|nr:tolloid-like protein 2 [Centruroides sculpturatus]